MRNRKDKSSSIHLQDTIRVTSTRSSKKVWWNYLIEFLLVFIGSASVLYGVILALELPVWHQSFLSFGFLITLIFMILCQMKRYKVIAWPVAFAILFYLVYGQMESIANGFFYVENAILKQINQYFGLRLYLYIAQGDPIQCVTTFFLIIFVLLALLLSFVVWMNCTRLLYLILVGILYGGVLLLGIVPPWRPLLVTLIVVYMVQTMDYIPVSVHRFQRKKNHRIRNTGGAKQGIRVKAGVTICIITLLAMFLGFCILTPGKYKTFDLKTKKHQMQTFFQDFSYEDTMDMLRKKFGEIPFLKEKEIASGGLNSGKINQVAEVVFTRETALRLTIPKTFAWCYLKGYAGVTYEEDHWGDLSKQEQEKYQLLQEKYGESYHGEDLFAQFLETILDSTYISDDNSVRVISTALNLQADLQNMTVEYVNANEKFFYAPYFVKHTPLSGNIGVGDQYFKPVKKEKIQRIEKIYHFSDYYDINSIALDFSFRAEQVSGAQNNELQEFWTYEKEYRNFVEEAYLKLPEEGIPRVKELLFPSDDTGNRRKLDIISEVIAYLNQNTDYSLSPGLVPKGKDYVEYFLFENHKGYCAHYASAATLMLRANGVPARYVEGYIVTQEDTNHALYEETGSDKTVDIKDTNAHAWVEVYFDTLGWLPIEVTKGYSNSGTTELLPEITENVIPTPTILVTNTPTPLPTNTPKPTQSITPKPTISETNTPTKFPSDENKKGEGNKEEVSVLFLWIKNGSVVILLAVVLFYVRYRVIWNIRWAKLRKGSKNRRVMSCYLEIEGLLEYLGYEKRNTTSYQIFADEVCRRCSVVSDEFKDIIFIVLKARFSKDEITQGEYEQVLSFYMETRVRIFDGNTSIKRFLLKYWKCL